MKLPAMFKTVKTAANYANIEGVLIGSCSVGNNIDDFISTTKDSSIAWIFGYTCEIGWLASTIIDVSIFEYLMSLRRKDLQDRDKIVRAFVKALRKFNGDYPLCKEKGKKAIPLRDAITLVVQPRGLNQKATDETANLLQKLGWTKTKKN